MAASMSVRGYLQEGLIMEMPPPELADKGKMPPEDRAFYMEFGASAALAAAIVLLV